MTFTHLEVHSHFTLLGATPSVPDLVARAQTDSLTYLALTKPWFRTAQNALLL